MPNSAPPSPPAAPANQMVTASELVRHFGVWQDRAVRAPVYVVHRGRPRLVLTSVELMDALCAPHVPDAAGPLSLSRLLASAREVVLAVDGELHLTAMSDAARGVLGAGTAVGAALGDAWPSPHGFLADVVRRVVGSGTPEVVEVAGPRPSRLQSVLVEPLGAGALILGRDVTAEEQARDLRGECDATATALAAAGGAVVPLSLRGHPETPATGLARLTGLDAGAVAATRFATLFDVATRADVSRMVERVLGGGEPAMGDATLLIRSGPLAVRVGLAPRVRGPATDGAIAVLLPRPPA